jgi:broad specificity phosphatase PhoE
LNSAAFLAPPHLSPPHKTSSTSEINEHIAKHPWGLPGFVDPGLRDAKLSADGVALARSRGPTFLKEHAQFLADTRLIVSSPLTRALHTAQLLLSGTQAQVPLVMLPLASERVYLT